MGTAMVKLLLNPVVFAGLVEVHINMDWPRFIVSMCVVAGFLSYMVYSWVRR